LFNGSIDDFRIYNYELTASQIADLSGGLSNGIEPVKSNGENYLTIWPTPATDVLNVSTSVESTNRLSTISVFNTSGSLVISKEIQNTSGIKLDVSNLQSGIYMLRLTAGTETLMKKFIVIH